MSIQSPGDLNGMRRAGRVVAFTLRAMKAALRADMTTAELDAVAAGAFRRAGARSAPQLAYGFPGTTCISVNDQIVHGIPGPRRIRPGDVVKIDVTAELNGYIADAATTVLVPPVGATAVRLTRSTSNALQSAIAAARSGQRVAMIGRAVESEARRSGFAVIRELCGHGVGRKIHEPPEVLNYESGSSREMLTEGLVIAVEPMLTELPSNIVPDDDGWTIRTRNGCLAAHEEHTVVITGGAPLVLTIA